MDVMKSYYNRYSTDLSDNQYLHQAKSFDQSYFQTFSKEEETLKNPEMYDVNTYDSFMSTTSDLTDLSSLSEAEKYTYGNFNFFTLKRTQFNNNEDSKNTTILNQDKKNARGMISCRLTLI